MKFFLKDCDQQWWEMFVNQFFEDDAILTLSISLDEEIKRFSKKTNLFFHVEHLSLDVNRILIPRFFRTLFEGDVQEVYFLFKHSKETVHHPLITFDCENGSMIMQVGKPSFIKVQRNKISFSQIFDQFFD